MINDLSNNMLLNRKSIIYPTLTFRQIHNQISHCEKAVAREESMSKCSQGSSTRIKVATSNQSLDMTSSLEKGSSQSSANSLKKSLYGIKGVDSQGKTIGGTRPRVMTKTSFIDTGNQELDNANEAVSHNLKVPSTSKENGPSVPGK